MKNYYLACYDGIKTGDAFPKHFAYVLRVHESSNVFTSDWTGSLSYFDENSKRHEAKRIAGNIMPSLKRAKEVCRAWNEAFVKNGTIFDERYCFDCVFDL